MKLYIQSYVKCLARGTSLKNQPLGDRKGEELRDEHLIGGRGIDICDFFYR